jgi:hypothetical protein
LKQLNFLLAFSPRWWPTFDIAYLKFCVCARFAELGLPELVCARLVWFPSRFYIFFTFCKPIAGVFTDNFEILGEVLSEIFLLAALCSQANKEPTGFTAIHKLFINSAHQRSSWRKEKKNQKIIKLFVHQKHKIQKHTHTFCPEKF